MEMTITKLEELEATKRGLDARIARAVALASTGESNGTELPELTQRLAKVNEEIQAERAEQQRAARRAKTRERGLAESDFPVALAECEKQRTALLEHVRAACLAWGEHRTLLARLYALGGKLSHETLGPLPEFQNQARRLELGDALQQSVADLHADWGGGWQLTFPIAPKYFKPQNER
jgi:hypothetical protein